MAAVALAAAVKIIAIVVSVWIVFSAAPVSEIHLAGVRVTLSAVNAAVAFTIFAMIVIERCLLAFDVVDLMSYYLLYVTELVHCTHSVLTEVCVKVCCDYRC